MPLRSLQVLVLDDDPILRALLTQMLRDLQVGAVLAAADGEEGLRLLDMAAPTPNLLICDLAMPGMDGVEFLRHVAARGYSGDVLLLSGAANSVLKAAERLANEHAIGIIDVLEKPVDLNRLTEVLSRGSRRRASRLAGMALPTLSIQDLHEGLASCAVELHYQPKLSLRTGGIIGAECLARWRHPLHGLLPPAAFITQVEQHGLIDAFTLCVFRLAVAQQRIWLDRGLSLTLNVNLSMDNLLRIDLPETLEAMARSAGVPPRGLVLEMTESRLISNLKLGLEILIRLRLKGFSLSIDDFGTGFSTMEALRQLPFTELKIDRAFIQGVDTDATARAILHSSAGLGRALGMNVVAEGVETRGEWEAVVAAGCDEIQGYKIAKPLAAPEFERWLAARQTPKVART